MHGDHILVEGHWVDDVVGIDAVRVEIVFVHTPDGHGRWHQSAQGEPDEVGRELRPRTC